MKSLIIQQSTTSQSPTPTYLGFFLSGLAFRLTWSDKRESTVNLRQPNEHGQQKTKNIKQQQNSTRHLYYTKLTFHSAVLSVFQKSPTWIDLLKISVESETAWK